MDTDFSTSEDTVVKHKKEKAFTPQEKVKKTV